MTLTIFHGSSLRGCSCVDRCFSLASRGGCECTIGLRHQSIAAKDAGNSLRRLGTIPKPVPDTLVLQRDGGWIGQRVVEANLFNEAPIPGKARLGGNDTVARTLFGAHAAEAKFDHA